MAVADDIIRIARLGFTIKVATLALEKFKKRIKRERTKWF